MIPGYLAYEPSATLDKVPGKPQDIMIPAMFDPFTGVVRVDPGRADEANAIRSKLQYPDWFVINNANLITQAHLAEFSDALPVKRRQNGSYEMSGDAKFNPLHAATIKRMEALFSKDGLPLSEDLARLFLPPKRASDPNAAVSPFSALSRGRQAVIIDFLNQGRGNVAPNPFYLPIKRDDTTDGNGPIAHAVDRYEEAQVGPFIDFRNSPDGISSSGSVHTIYRNGEALVDKTFGAYYAELEKTIALELPEFGEDRCVVSFPEDPHEPKDETSIYKRAEDYSKARLGALSNKQGFPIPDAVRELYPDFQTAWELEFDSGYGAADRLAARASELNLASRFLPQKAEVRTTLLQICEKAQFTFDTAREYLTVSTSPLQEHHTSSTRARVQGSVLSQMANSANEIASLIKTILVEVTLKQLMDPETSKLLQPAILDCDEVVRAAQDAHLKVTSHYLPALGKVAAPLLNACPQPE